MKFSNLHWAVATLLTAVAVGAAIVLANNFMERQQQLKNGGSDS